jgi:hypothetical protein
VWQDDITINDRKAAIGKRSFMWSQLKHEDKKVTAGNRQKGNYLPKVKRAGDYWRQIRDKLVR